MSTESKFKSGQKVEAREYTTGKWRKAVIATPSPYRRGRCDGAYIYWDDFSGERKQWESAGGWASENSIRELATA